MGLFVFKKRAILHIIANNYNNMCNIVFFHSKLDFFINTDLVCFCYSIGYVLEWLL